MTFRAASEKEPVGEGQQAASAFQASAPPPLSARLIEMPELVLGPHGTIEGASLEFLLLQCASTCGADIRQPVTAEVSAATKDPWQMLLIPEFKLG